MKRCILSILITTLMLILMGCSKTNGKKTSYEVPAIEATNGITEKEGTWEIHNWGY